MTKVCQLIVGKARPLDNLITLNKGEYVVLPVWGQTTPPSQEHVANLFMSVLLKCDKQKQMMEYMKNESDLKYEIYRDNMTLNDRIINGIPDMFSGAFIPRMLTYKDLTELRALDPKHSNSYLAYYSDRSFPTLQRSYTDKTHIYQESLSDVINRLRSNKDVSSWLIVCHVYSSEVDFSPYQGIPLL